MKVDNISKVLCVFMTFLLVCSAFVVNGKISINKGYAASKSSTETKTTVKDEILLAVFMDDTNGKTGFNDYLYTSTDGKSFKAGKSGKKRVVAGPMISGDPSITYFDGNFWLLTSGGNNQEHGRKKAVVSVQTSSDLVHWSHATHVDIPIKNPPAAGKCDHSIDTTAAEWFNDGKDLYITAGLGKYYDCAPLANKIKLFPYITKVTKLTGDYRVCGEYYCSPTMKTEPFKKIKFKKTPNYGLRDSYILQKDGKYYLFLKPNEWASLSSTDKKKYAGQIFESTKLAGPYTMLNVDITNQRPYKLYEGASAVYFKGKYFVYQDQFDETRRKWPHGGQIMVSTGKSLNYGALSKPKSIKTTPYSSTRHGTVYKPTDPDAVKKIKAFRAGKVSKNFMMVPELGLHYDIKRKDRAVKYNGKYQNPKITMPKGHGKVTYHYGSKTSKTKKVKNVDPKGYDVFIDVTSGTKFLPVKGMNMGKFFIERSPIKFVSATISPSITFLEYLDPNSRPKIRYFTSESDRNRLVTANFSGAYDKLVAGKDYKVDELSYNPRNCKSIGTDYQQCTLTVKLSFNDKNGNYYSKVANNYNLMPGTKVTVVATGKSYYNLPG